MTSSGGMYSCAGTSGTSGYGCSIEYLGNDCLLKSVTVENTTTGAACGYEVKLESFSGNAVANACATVGASNAPTTLSCPIPDANPTGSCSIPGGLTTNDDCIGGTYQFIDVSNVSPECQVTVGCKFSIRARAL